MKIKYRQYAEFLKEWDKNKKEIHPLRFGQLFCNTHNITDPELFYNGNVEECIDIIMDKYLDLEFSDLGLML